MSMQDSGLDDIHTTVNRKVEERVASFQDKLMEMIESEKELIQFEILHSMLIEPKEEVRRLVKEERQKAWKEALERTDGDEEEAIEIFDELYP